MYTALENICCKTEQRNGKAAKAGCGVKRFSCFAYDYCCLYMLKLKMHYTKRVCILMAIIQKKWKV